MDKTDSSAAALLRRGIFRGVDLAALARRLWSLTSMRAEKPLPEIRWRAWSSGWAAGRAWRSRATLRIGMNASVEDAAEVLLHELVHCSCPAREHHGELFCRRLIACAKEAFDLPLDVAALLALPAGQHKNRAYAIDGAIKNAMIAAGVGERLRDDPGLRFAESEPEAPEQKETKREAAREARAVEKRTHAEKMLAEWEARLRRAKRISAKWRKRVRYYERREPRAAAKSRAAEAGSRGRRFTVGP